MALQQAMFFDLITSMKKANARNDDASDSDDSITQTTNRGNKLKRKAKYVQEGRLAQADGPRVYKRRLNYNGYTRNIISKTVPRVDPDGDLIDDEENSDPDLSPAEDDPYVDVKLEQLLMPLTSAADLDKHPSLSIPYSSTILEGMVQESEDMLHREEAALWRVKRLLVQFRGDDGWAPCGMFEADADPSLLQSLQPIMSAPPSVDLEVAQSSADVATWDMASEARHIMAPEDNVEAGSIVAKVHTTEDRTANTDAVKNSRDLPSSKTDEARSGERHSAKPNARPGPLLGAALTQDEAIGVNKVDDATSAAMLPNPAPVDAADHHAPSRDPEQEHAHNVNGIPLKEAQVGTKGMNQNQDRPLGSVGATDAQAVKTEGDANATLDEPAKDVVMEDAPNQGEDRTAELSAPSLSSRQDTRLEEVTAASNGGEENNEDDDDGSHSHRMTTRARAQANPDTASQSAAEVQANGDATPSIHPFFIAPTETLPYRAQGLRTPLLDEVRIALSAYTQRQEEVVRQCTALLSGLRKALLMKKTVWSWCRNEAHVGEMSDGEDWVDMEEWSLDEPLKKGEEVEDEEVAVGLTKKTRNRRAAA